MTNASDGGKGSGRRPGTGYQDGWARIFGPKEPDCTQCTQCAPASECRASAVGASVCERPPQGGSTQCPAQVENGCSCFHSV